MALEQDIVRLARTRPFAIMPREALQLVAFASQKLHLPPQKTLFDEGDWAEEGFFVLAGSLKLWTKSETRERSQIAEADSFIGESALFVQVRRPTSALTLEACVVLRITRDTMTKVLLEFPRAAKDLRDDLANRSRQLAQELDDVRLRALEIE